MKFDVSQTLAGLALFLAVFMLWMAIDDDPPVRELTAVVPANLGIASKPVDPPATASPAVAPPAIAPDPDNQVASALPTNSSTITIIDGKTGEKKEVIVSAPALVTSTSAIASRTLGENDTIPADRTVAWADTSASLPVLRGAATIAAARPSLPASSTSIPSLPDSNDYIDSVMPAIASLNGSIPLPRRRPAPFAIVENAALPSVPLPRVRPPDAPEPMNDTTAEVNE